MTSSKQVKSKNKKHQPPKPRLVADENVWALSRKDIENGLDKKCKLVSSEELVGAGAEDKIVYQVANQKGYHIITQDYNDFQKVRKNPKKNSQSNVGIIGIQGDLTRKKINRLEEVIRTNDHNYFYDRLTVISENSTRVTKLRY